MSRFDRKKRGWNLLNVKLRGGLTDLMDNVIKETWYINDEEFDLLCTRLTDEELGLFLSESPTFSQKRILLNLIDRYIDMQIHRDNQLDKLL